MKSLIKSDYKILDAKQCVFRDLNDFSQNVEAKVSARGYIIKLLLFLLFQRL